MLMPVEDLLGILRCPKTGAKLEEIDDVLVAADGENKHCYDVVSKYPVLVDFEKSVLKAEGIKSLSSVVNRRSYNPLLAAIKRIISPPKSTTAENVEYLLNLLKAESNKPKILVIGGGTIGQGMSLFYEDQGIDLVSFDIYASPSVQFVADAHCIPLSSSTFDAVIIQAVLEHVLDPNIVVAEIYRVLKEDGIVYAETPFLQHVHEGPYDFTRFTESGHRYLFKYFERIKSGASAGAGTQLVWSLDNFFRGLFRSRKIGKIIKIFFFWLQFFDSLIPDTYNVDSASGVFFLGRKQSEPVGAEEIIKGYKGAQI